MVTKSGHIGSAAVGNNVTVKASWFEYGTSRIYYEEQGSGDPILLLPGFSDSIKRHSALRDTLAANYRVIAADLPGSGRSEPQPRKYAASYYEDDARAFTALLEYLSVGPTHLLGFSDGGEVSLLISALHPEIARSVVIWGAAGHLSDPNGQLRAAMYNIIDNPIPPLKEYSEFLTATYGKDNARIMAQSHVDALNDIMARGGDVGLSQADNITCPVLLIAGEHDMFVTPTLLAQSASRLPTAQALTVDGAGHDVHNARPEWLVQTISDWLKQH